MTAAELAGLWAKVERAVEEHAVFPPGPLGAFDWDDVAAGAVATRKQGGTVVGVGLLACDRPACWLSLTDDDPIGRVEGLTEVRLEGRWASSKVLYQLVDLPWPLQDRHWVLSLWTNTALAKAADVWERAWKLAPERLAPERVAPLRDRVGAERFDAAVAVPENQGGWLLLPVGDRTLGVYQVRVDLGGAVPEEAARGYAASTMKENFAKVEANAADVRRRYGKGCAPQPGGDGTPIPCFP